MKFKNVAHAFEQIRAESSRLKMMQIVADLLKQSNPEEAAIIAYMVLGLLRAPYKGATLFQIAERSMLGIVADVCNESEEMITAKFAKAGDLGDVIMLYTWNGTASYTISQVHERLVALEAVHGEGSQEARRRSAVELLSSVSPEEAAILVRLILGKQRLGCSDMTVLEAVSMVLVGDKSQRDLLVRAYALCADLGVVVKRALQGGVSDIMSHVLHVGIPVRPAAAERLPTAQAVFEKMGACIAQPKLDGFRLQIHVWRESGAEVPSVKCFSRNLLDMTGMFPDVEAAVRKLPMQSAIFDSEAVAFDEATGAYLSFQATVKRRRKHDVEALMESHPLKCVLFDILELNGVILYDKPHAQRYAQLAALNVGSYGGALALISEQYITSAQALEQYFMTCVQEGYEGIMVKKENAEYHAGTRSFNWIKLKRHEIGQLEDTIDAVVLGYYYGQGKRAKFGIGAVLVGVYDAQVRVWTTIAKIGTGFSDAEWQSMRESCDRYRMTEKPRDVRCAEGLFPDVWVSPAIVLEIAADEITKSPVHTTPSGDQSYGLALRFPRVMAIRSDKSPSDATTVDEVHALYAQQKTRQT